MGRRPDRKAASSRDVVLGVGLIVCDKWSHDFYKRNICYPLRVNCIAKLAWIGHGRNASTRRMTMVDALQYDRPAEGPTASPLELTILMPCLNEAETISTCVAKAKSFLARAGISGEVLIADNGSYRGSVGLGQRAGARVNAVAARRYGAAFRARVPAELSRFV